MRIADPEDLPVAVIGAGPVGLAAAAHLLAQGLPVKLYEAAPAVAANLRDWGHVRVFTPWRYCVDPAAAALLKRQGWRPPAVGVFPTGAEIVARYLEPLAATPELAAVIETGARVTAISRLGLDKVVSRGRKEHPFLLTVASKAGFAVIWRAPSSMPPAPGRHRTRWGPAVCRPRAKPPSRIGSPMASPTSSAAPGMSMPG